MFRCPSCHVELPSDARFCNKCGFNQTNARMVAIAQLLKKEQADKLDEEEAQSILPATPKSSYPKRPRRAPARITLDPEKAKAYTQQSELLGQLAAPSIHPSPVEREQPYQHEVKDVASPVLSQDNDPSISIQSESIHLVRTNTPAVELVLSPSQKKATRAPSPPPVTPTPPASAPAKGNLLHLAPGGQQEKHLSLKQRYIADQQTHNHPAQQSTPSTDTPAKQASSSQGSAQSQLQEASKTRQEVSQAPAAQPQSSSTSNKLSSPGQLPAEAPGQKKAQQSTNTKAGSRIPATADDHQHEGSLDRQLESTGPAFSTARAEPPLLQVRLTQSMRPIRTARVVVSNRKPSTNPLLTRSGLYLILVIMTCIIIGLGIGIVYLVFRH